MNNANANQTIQFDTLGRRKGIAKGFSLYGEGRIAELRDFLQLHMSPSDLAFIRNYYSSKKYSDISFGELYLLDGIVTGARESRENAALTDIYTDDKNIIETYDDLISKHTALCGENFPPLPIDEAAKVCPKYMERIEKAYDCPFLPHELKRENGRSLISVLSDYSAKKELEPNTAFVIITPCGEDCDYKDTLESFASSSVFAKYVISAQMVRKTGIAAALAKMTNGIYADIFSIPGLPRVPELSHLATECRGYLIAAMPKYAIEEFSASAAQYGLSAAYFAKAVPSDDILLYKQEHISMRMDTALISALASLTYSKDFHIRKDGRAHIGYLRSQVLMSTENLTREQIIYGSTIHSCDMIFSPVAAEIKTGFFVNSLNAAIDSLLPLIACGIPREDISISVRYEFPDADGNALASILGIYRTLTELCISNAAETEYTDADGIFVSCTAHCGNEHIILPSSFTAEDNLVYFLSYDENDNGIPDFEGLRGMFDYVRSLSSSGTIKSARAVSGNLSDALAQASGSYDFERSEGASLLFKGSRRGIIAEVSAPIEHGVLLGKISKFIW